MIIFGIIMRINIRKETRIMRRVPTKCPICGKSTHVAVVKCDNCGTTISNKFGFSAFDKLDGKQTEFALAFIECEGSIKEMEKRFDISYPTVKARLAEIKTALGLAAAKQTKLDILRELESDRINVDEAIKLIQNKED